MDVALGPYILKSVTGEDITVLILVVMDVALGQFHIYRYSKLAVRLNPCCNGCRTWAKYLIVHPFF